MSEIRKLSDVEVRTVQAVVVALCDETFSQENRDIITRVVQAIVDGRWDRAAHQVATEITLAMRHIHRRWDLPMPMEDTKALFAAPHRQCGALSEEDESIVYDVAEYIKNTDTLTRDRIVESVVHALAQGQWDSLVYDMATNVRECVDKMYAEVLLPADGVEDLFSNPQRRSLPLDIDAKIDAGEVFFHPGRVGTKPYRWLSDWVEGENVELPITRMGDADTDLYICDDCGEGFEWESAAIYHWLEHHITARWLCDRVSFTVLLSREEVSEVLAKRKK